MPLLRQLNLRAILFAIPARITDAAATRPTIDDAGANDAGPAAAPAVRHLARAARHARQRRLRRPVAHALAREGLLRFDRHRLRDARVRREPIRSTGRSIRRTAPIRFVEPDALGTPLYLRRSRMSDARRFLPDERDGRTLPRSTWRAQRRRRLLRSPGWRSRARAARRRATGASRPTTSGRPPFATRSPKAARC